MRFSLIVLCSLMVTAAACGRTSGERRFTLQGQVTAVSPDQAEATIKHEEIKGLMPAMTMPYRVRDPKLLAGIAPGDLIDATLVVGENDAYLATVKKVGSAPLEKVQADDSTSSPAPGAVPALKPGEMMPDANFVDQDGKRRRFSSFRGSTVVLTFIYTRCPLPDFCPRMDRNFVRLQQEIEAKPPLQERVHLVTISFDPKTDTPPVLKEHARTLRADPKLWTFLTGERDEIGRFGAPLGLSVMYEDDNSVTHNLRTAVIDPAGKLVRVFNGNDWTPSQILTAIGAPVGDGMN